MDLKHFLKTLPAFESFAEADIDVLSGCMAVSSHPAGHTFITQGQQGEALYLLMAGAIQTTHVDEVTGAVQETRDLHTGELFGLLSLIDRMPAGWGSVSLEAVTVAALSREDFGRLFQSAPAIAHHLQYMVAVQLARNLQERNRDLRDLLKKRAVETAN